TSVFMNDPRAATVQTDAASSLFAHDRFSEAVVLAEEIPQIWTDAEPSLVASSLKITGHSRFELGQFHQAESAYKTLLDTGVLTDSSEVDSINERLMASIYKQAEATEALGEVDAAIGHFLRIAEVNAGSTLAQQGLFDAVAVLESQDRLAAAALLLDRFRDSYPDHLLGNDAPIRLASMYERSEQWPLAAQELLIIAETDVQPELKAQSLYRAAEIYLQLDDVDLALEHFRTYAHTYPAPAEVALEAMNHMDLLYQRVDDQEKRRFWLNRKIALHKEMGRGATQRATYLAAEAQFVFAEDERNAFEAIALTNPLKKSLKTKQTALKRTLSAYEKATDYKVETFSTASTYRIANLYSNLASAVMASERPQKLSALEMEQYEILLEEQAFPFEEQAIELHEINMRRSWEGVYDEWVQLSFTALRHLMPARFDKDETEVAYVRSIH
ncbi:MAG: tetratricopeptide repeat protein, partial [Proteobacteria bacterium]|nr:tetratricopeptide repeat protein [Pseudomonadota bacterium]